MTTGRPVIVKQLPQRLIRGQADLFLAEMQSFLQSERPRLVFDFSRVEQVDSAGIEILLTCMEEVMKRNGDLKLAAVAAGPSVILELTGVDRLFEIFEKTADAVESFHHFPVHAYSQVSMPWYSGAATQGQ